MLRLKSPGAEGTESGEGRARPAGLRGEPYRQGNINQFADFCQYCCILTVLPYTVYYCSMLLIEICTWCSMQKHTLAAWWPQRGRRISVFSTIIFAKMVEVREKLFLSCSGLLMKCFHSRLRSEATEIGPHHGPFTRWMFAFGPCQPCFGHGEHSV